jgi:hypothetical protein
MLGVMKILLWIMLGMVLAARLCHAQAPDVEIMQKQLVALKAEYDLLQTMFRKREAEWSAYSKPLWEAAPSADNSAPSKTPPAGQ